MRRLYVPAQGVTPPVIPGRTSSVRTRNPEVICYLWIPGLRPEEGASRNDEGTPLIIAPACVDSPAAAVFPSHLVTVKSRRERPAQDAGAEGATAPETLRQTDRATC